MLAHLVQQLVHTFLRHVYGLFYSLVVLSLLWRAVLVVQAYKNRPKNIPIFSRPYAPRRWLKNFDFIFDAPHLILQASRDSHFASSFAIPSLAEYQVLTCSREDIETLCNSGEDVLSFHEAMTDRMKHYYTIYGFEHNDIDPHDSIPNRVVKVLLRMHLPVLSPLIERKIRDGFQKVVSNEAEIHGWTSVSTYKLSKVVIEESNAQVIMGDELGNQPECVSAAIRYTEDVVLAAEVTRQLPALLTPLIAPVIMRWSGAMQKLANFVSPIVEERLQRGAAKANLPPTYMGCIKWVIEASHTPAQLATPRLVAQILGILLASSHQMSMTLVYVIYALCDHPEYIEPLRKEIASASRTNSQDPFKEMHFLDSFLLEVARLNPPDALTVQRKVKKPITLPSGAYIPPNNLIAVPQLALGHNPNVFPDPMRFDGRRFLLKNEEQRETEPITKFTDVRYTHMFWGPPRKACPGRWYVSHTLKQAMVHLLMNYDFKLENESRARVFYWTTAIFPRPNVRVLLRKRTNPE